ncbi:MAG: M23 family metallopeptidase, partial [Synergistaceae bacterium]|nr:M23 family metallopeptidase [Synergistaceae bacterium]
MQRGDQNSRFEANQMKQYRDGEADAAIKLGLDDIAANYEDEAAVEQIKQGLDAAVELRTRGMGADAKRAAWAEIDNRIAMTRLSRMLEADPEKAAAWFGEHQKEFTADGLVKAEASVKRAVETYEVQELAGALFSKYGPDGEKAALQEVRDNYSGERENRLASMVKTLYQEHDIDTAKEERLKSLHQKEQEDALYRMWVRDGAISQELVDQMYMAGKISPSGHNSLSGLAASQATRAQVEKRLLKANPGMTQGELDSAVMRQMRVSGEEYRQIFAQAARGVMSGTVTDKDLDFWYQRGRLTGADVARLKKRGKDLDDIQKRYLTGQRGELTNALKDYVKNYSFPEELVQRALDRFDVKVLEETEAGLNPRDPKYREKIFDIRKNVLLWSIDQSGKELNGWWSGRSELGEKYDNIKDARFHDPFPELPELEPTEVELGAAASSNTGHIGMDFLGGGGTTVKGGEYLASGGNRKHTHQGQDYAMPEGTAVTVPESLNGLEMKVSNVGYDDKSGNKLHLSGEYNNHTFRLFMCHFQNDSIQVKNGQTVTAGDVLANVGSTGHSSGAHLHIETFIDGRRVPPAKFYELIGIGMAKKPEKPKEPKKTELGMGIFSIPEPR